MIPFLLAHQTYEVEKRDHLEQVYKRTTTKKVYYYGEYLIRGTF